MMTLTAHIMYNTHPPWYFFTSLVLRVSLVSPLVLFVSISWWCMWEGVCPLVTPWCYMWDGCPGLGDAHPPLLSELGREWPMTGLYAGGPGWREPGAPPTTLDPSSSQPNVNASRPKSQTQKTNIKHLRGATIQGKINCTVWPIKWGPTPEKPHCLNLLEGAMAICFWSNN